MRVLTNSSNFSMKIAPNEEISDNTDYYPCFGEKFLAESCQSNEIVRNLHRA